MNSMTKLSRFGGAAALALAFAAPASAGIIGSSTTSIIIPDVQIPDDPQTPESPERESANSTINISAHGIITALSVSIAVNHTYIGDLIYTLKHGNKTVVLMSQPGLAPDNFGNQRKFSDSAPLEFSDFVGLAQTEDDTIGGGCADDKTVGIDTGCAATAYLSLESMSAFAGLDMFGKWILTIKDKSYSFKGDLSRWSLSDTDLTVVPEPGMLALLGLALAAMGAAGRRPPQP